MLFPDKPPLHVTEPAIVAWKQVSTRTMLDCHPWLKVHEDSICLPGGRNIHDYYRIESPDYVIMAVRDATGRFLLERMYKHGVGSIILTSPSGGIDAHETPLEAAQRELLEETGIEAQQWIPVGSYHIDGTRGICKAHFFIAQELNQVALPEQHDIETCAIELLTIDDIAEAIRDGSICLLPDIALYSLVLGPFKAAMEKWY